MGALVPAFIDTRSPSEDAPRSDTAKRRYELNHVCSEVRSDAHGTALRARGRCMPIDVVGEFKPYEPLLGDHASAEQVLKQG